MLAKALKEGKTLMCKPCALKLRPVTWKKNPEELCVNQGAYKSYVKAKRRAETNHKGAYSHVEFRFRSYDEFLSELGPRPEGMTLDRINPGGHYEPGNVRWATMAEQCRNKRSNIFVTYNGERMCLHDACRLSGRDQATIKRRLKKGVPEELLFLEGRIDSPPKNCDNACMVIYNGKVMYLHKAAKMSGVSAGTILKRIKEGVPLDLLFTKSAPSSQ